MDVLINLEFFDKQDTNTGKLNWIGPDHVNVLGIRYKDIQLSKNLKELQYQAKNYAIKFKYECTDREILFLSGLLPGAEYVRETVCCIWNSLKFPLAPNKEIGFGRLKSERNCFVITKNVSVLGSKASNNKSSIKVDFVIPNNKISKQHAIIIWNFILKCFEIKCLSSSNSILVNGELISRLDPPKPLKDLSVIIIADEKFLFQLPVITK